MQQPVSHRAVSRTCHGIGTLSAVHRAAYCIHFDWIGRAVGVHTCPKERGTKTYAAVNLVLAVLGGATAGRQIWLQTIPADQLPACLPSLEYMLEAFPFQDIVRNVLHGTADCAEVKWTFLTLSIPEWSLLAFLGCAAVALRQLLKRRRDWRLM